jgi:hypothetical protein
MCKTCVKERVVEQGDGEHGGEVDVVELDREEVGVDLHMKPTSQFEKSLCLKLVQIKKKLSKVLKNQDKVMKNQEALAKDMKSLKTLQLSSSTSSRKSHTQPAAAQGIPNSPRTHNAQPPTPVTPLSRR